MPRKGEMSELVQRVMREAKQRSGKSAVLAAKMAPLLGDFVYGDSAISAWISGRDRPPAEALLAAAKLSDISVDEYLYGQTLRQRVDRIEKDAEALRIRVDQLFDRLRRLTEE